MSSKLHYQRCRKPLIIRGARQVGETWLVRKFADQFENLVEINFDKNPEKAQLFSGRDIKRCLQLLQIDCDTEIRIRGKNKVSFLLVSLPLYLVGQARRLIADGFQGKISRCAVSD